MGPCIRTQWAVRTETSHHGHGPGTLTAEAISNIYMVNERYQGHKISQTSLWQVLKGLNILMWGTDRPHGPGTLDPRDWPWESVGPMMCDRKTCRNSIKSAEAAFRAP